MVFVHKTAPSKRKTILIVDNHNELEQLVKAPLLEQLAKADMAAVVVRAKDGAEAAIKSENQKFDMVLIDTEVPRLMEGGFIYGIQSYKNTQDAELLVVSQKDSGELPESLRHSKFFKKPVNPQHLVEAMISCLNAQHHGTPNKESAAPPSSANKFAVDVRVINAIIKSTTNVFVQFGVANVKMEKAIQKSSSDVLMGEVSSVMNISSKSFQGYLTISFDKASYLEVCSAMLMEEQTDITPDNQDAVGEINNIIFGNAKAEITNYGIELTTPKVLMGSGQQISCPAGTAAMCIPFSTEKGKFYMTVFALPLANAV